MPKNLISAIFLLTSCASLDRVEPQPDARTPDAAPADAPPISISDACDPPPPPPPECTCSNDCDHGEVCSHGACHERCWCDNNCSSASQSCEHGVCE